jgi:hypothetical protein
VLFVHGFRFFNGFRHHGRPETTVDRGGKACLRYTVLLPVVGDTAMLVTASEQVNIPTTLSPTVSPTTGSSTVYMNHMHTAVMYAVIHAPLPRPRSTMNTASRMESTCTPGVFRSALLGCPRPALPRVQALLLLARGGERLDGCTGWSSVLEAPSSLNPTRFALRTPATL